jgi:outer membrane protein OmpA-like peptidoglycan-associated protein
LKKNKVRKKKVRKKKYGRRKKKGLTLPRRERSSRTKQNKEAAFEHTVSDNASSLDSIGIQSNDGVSEEISDRKELYFNYAFNEVVPERERSEVLNLLFKEIRSRKWSRLEIIGHTDDIGSDSYNQQLSERRAEVLYQWLLEEGVRSKSISYKGLGESEPLESNSTEWGRSKNRRVELIFYQ